MFDVNLDYWIAFNCLLTHETLFDYQHTIHIKILCINRIGL